MSSSSPFPGPPPPGQSQGPPPPPPPPPPSHPPDPSNSNYFFGFVVTFIVLLLLFIGCGVGSWRRFQLLARSTAEWDLHRARKRRRARPVFFDTWTQTADSSTRTRWTGVQPISVAFVWSRSALALRHGPSRPKTRASSREPNAHGGDRFMSLELFWRPRAEPPKPPPVERPRPEAIQVAVMIAMPSRWPVEEDGRCVGHVGQEYEIGVVRIPWPSVGDGT